MGFREKLRAVASPVEGCLGGEEEEATPIG